MRPLVLGRCHRTLRAPVNAGGQRVLDELVREALERRRVAGMQRELRLQRARLHELHRHAVRAEEAGRLRGRGEGQGEGEREHHGPSTWAGRCADNQLSEARASGTVLTALIRASYELLEHRHYAATSAATRGAIASAHRGKRRRIASGASHTLLSFFFLRCFLATSL